MKMKATLITAMCALLFVCTSCGGGSKSDGCSSSADQERFGPDSLGDEERFGPDSK